MLKKGLIVFVLVCAVVFFGVKVWFSQKSTTITEEITWFQLAQEIENCNVVGMEDLHETPFTVYLKNESEVYLSSPFDIDEIADLVGKNRSKCNYPAVMIAIE